MKTSLISEKEPLSTILTASFNGTLIKRIRIQSRGITSDELIGFYVYDSTSKCLIQQIIFALNCNLSPNLEQIRECNYYFKPGWVLQTSEKNVGNYIFEMETVS